MRGSRGGEGVRSPPPPTHTLENHKAIGSLSNTRPGNLKNHKARMPAFNAGPSSARQRNADDGPLIVRQVFSEIFFRSVGTLGA